jgi:hypothetical protein
MYISCMNKEDIEQTVADLVEAIRTDAVIEVAKADYEFLSRQADDVHQAYGLAVVRAEDAHKQLLELQRHKRDVPALRERLLSLLAGGNISTAEDSSEHLSIGKNGVTPADRLAFIEHLNGDGKPQLGSHTQHMILMGKNDYGVRAWLDTGRDISIKLQVSPSDRLAYALSVYGLVSMCGEHEAARKAAHDVLDGKCDATVKLWLEER